MKKLEFLLILLLLAAVFVMATLPRWQIDFEARWNNNGDVSRDRETVVIEGDTAQNDPVPESRPSTAYRDIYSDLPVTRMEFLVLVSKRIGLRQETGEVPFVDIRSDSTNARYIYPMLKKGLIAGYPDQTFRPNDLITRNEAGIIIARVLGRPAPDYGEKSDYLTKKEMYRLLSNLEQRLKK